MSVKTREFSETFPHIGREKSKAGASMKQISKSKTLMGTQYTESEGHRRNKNGSWDGGGPFYTALYRRSFPTRTFKAGDEAKGPFVECDLGTPMPLSLIPVKYQSAVAQSYRSKDLSDLNPYGATAISLVSPTNPNAELSTALGEIYRDGLPSLPGIQTWKERTRPLLGVSSEYLNYIFGWSPLVEDIKNVSSSVSHSRTVLDQYQRGSGSTTRREFSFPDIISEASTVFPADYPSASYAGGGLTGWNGNLGARPIVQSIKTRTKRWFSGSFTYALPDRGDSWSNLHRAADEADHLLGITITPDVLWELTPWSWAVDWFSNTGQIINNATNFGIHGLVMRYGFMMEERTTTITHSFLEVPDNGFSSRMSFPPSSLEIRTKVRTDANPFGFGLKWDGLSPTQLAIAAALGITRLR